MSRRLLLLAVAAVGPAVVDSAAAESETRSVIAGRREYKTSWFFRKQFGEGYRTLRREDVRRLTILSAPLPLVEVRKIRVPVPRRSRTGSWRSRRESSFPREVRPIGR